MGRTVIRQRVQLEIDGRRHRVTLTPLAHYAGIGYTYDEQRDAFIPPKPHPSWTLDESYNWQPPTPYPDEGGTYTWDEDTLTWVEVAP